MKLPDKVVKAKSITVACPDRDCTEGDKPMDIKLTGPVAAAINLGTYYCSVCGYRLMDYDELMTARARDANG